MIAVFNILHSIIIIINKAHQGQHANVDLNTLLVNYVYQKSASEMVSMFGIFRSFHVHTYRSRKERILWSSVLE